MRLILIILGVLQIAGGVLVAIGAKSAIHEILGAISFGLGVLALGLSAIIIRLEEINNALRQGGPQKV